ncbi:hypothetical protein B0O99DRAFT_586006 [Bisporella sp. PMI_857]|nr:hypothetical protein B0O99DRAFT_586006 [Bisporella sp. PMI_857]
MGVPRDDLPPLGFIAVDVHFHRPPGDPYNEKTWPFPLIRQMADGSKLDQIVTNGSYSKEFLDRFIDAGQKLADQGCIGIITSCGFLAMAQQELAARLPVPIATSALIQIPAIRAFLPPQKSIGVITFDELRLGQLHLSKLGVSNPQDIHIKGVSHDSSLRCIIRDGAPYSHQHIEEELVQCAFDLVKAHLDLGAIVLECTQMPPFAEAVQERIKLPVYDVYTMGLWFYSGLVRKSPTQWK